MVDIFFWRVWRWHFWAGLVNCPVLLVVALTGALYAFREEIEDWQQADVRFVEPVGDRKPLSEQIAAVKAAHPNWRPTRVTLAADPRRSTVVQVERADAEKSLLSAVFVNPYTAALIADGEVRTPFFSTVIKLHRSLFAGTFGRVVVELTTSWTLVLLVSGFFLWWPNRWRRVWGVWLPRLQRDTYIVLRDLHTVGGVFLDIVALDPDSDGDCKDAKLLKTLKVGKSAVEGHFGHHDLAFDADNRFAFFTNPGDGTISALSLKTLEIVTMFEVGGMPTHLVARGGKETDD
jgi:hypothetical protein